VSNEFAPTVEVGVAFAQCHGQQNVECGVSPRTRATLGPAAAPAPARPLLLLLLLVRRPSGILVENPLPQITQHDLI